jgi:hypothetical protein
VTIGVRSHDGSGVYTRAQLAELAAHADEPKQQKNRGERPKALLRFVPRRRVNEAHTRPSLQLRASGLLRLGVLRKLVVMKLRTVLTVVALGSALCGGTIALLATRIVHAQGAQYVPPDRLRFRILSDEGVAMPDGRTIANNWKIVTLRDTRSGQCHVVFMGPVGMTVMEPATCLD